MNQIHLTDHEAKNIDRISVLVRPIDLPERRSEWKFTRISSELNYCFQNNGATIFIKCHYTVGQTVGLKESCWHNGLDYCRYKASDVGLLGGKKYSSPITMPSWAIRHHRIIAGIKVNRLRSISFEEIDRLGISSEYPDWESVANRQSALLDLWQSRYAKTKFAWDENPYVWIIELKQ